MTFQKWNHWLDQRMFIVMPVLIITGICFGHALDAFLGITSYLFMLLTFISTLKADLRSFRQVFRQPIFFACFMVLHHLLFPWFVWLIAGHLFPEGTDLSIGLTMCVLLPMGVTSIFWVSYNKGNLETVLAYVTMNTLISPFIVPAAFFVILGKEVSVDSSSLLISLVKLVLLPSTLGLLAGNWLRRNERLSFIEAGAALTSKACLSLIVLFNAAAISGQLQIIVGHLIPLFLSIFLVMVVGYLVSYFYSSWISKNRGMRIAVTYAGGVRNYTVGVVLASAYFSPAVGIPILIAMLLQHPVALLFVRFFNKATSPFRNAAETAWKHRADR